MMLAAAGAQARTFVLPPLPYAYDALEPHISRQTMQLHHSKHLQTYVNNLNSLVIGSKYSDADLETIVKGADGAIFNNAGQVLNHTLYFNQFSSKPQARPTGKLADAINKYFGSYQTFVEQYNKSAISLFGSGWVWLAKSPNGQLVITQEANAGNPMSRGLQPLLGCDVWEHAYYLDYQNRRVDHIDAFWKVVDWKVVEKLFEQK
jgi:Fe-Mn family superoxide dismutase